MEPRTGVRLYSILFVAIMISWMLLVDYLSSTATSNSLHATIGYVAVSLIVLTPALGVTLWKASQYSRIESGSEDWNRRKRAGATTAAVIVPAIAGMFYGLLTANLQLVNLFIVVTAIASILSVIYAIYVFGGIMGTIERI